MSKEKKSASGAKKEKLKKVNEVEDALPQDAEQKLTLIEDATESTAEKAEVAVKQAEKLGGKDAYEKLKALIAEMEVPEKTKEVFQKSLEDFTNLKNNIANNAQDKDLLIKEIDGIINKLNTKIEILTKTESTENPADSVSIEVNPDAPEPEKEPKPKKTRTRTKKETPTENTAPAEALKVGDTVELDPTITTPPVVAVAPDAPGAPEPIKTEAEITDKINQEIAQAEAQRLNEGKKPLTNYDKWQIAIKLMPPSDKELERRNNPGTRQKIENWWLGKNTDRASKLSLAATKAFIIGGTALLTNDVSHLGKGAWRVANSVATSYLGDTKAVKDLIGVVAGKYENLNKRQKLMAKGAVALAAGLAVGGGVALGAVTATGAGIGLA
ncbi:MAG: hypothetical protein NTW98_01195, partial [Candidatus Nomurabacteria bacterium]|nr:hypothetical protein [Candidatus Nomurabacteria bacterium]